MTGTVTKSINNKDNFDKLTCHNIHSNIPYNFVINYASYARAEVQPTFHGYTNHNLSGLV